MYSRCPYWGPIVSTVHEMYMMGCQEYGPFWVPYIKNGAQQSTMSLPNYHMLFNFLRHAHTRKPGKLLCRLMVLDQGCEFPSQLLGPKPDVVWLIKIPGVGLGKLPLSEDLLIRLRVSRKVLSKFGLTLQLLRLAQFNIFGQTISFVENHTLAEAM